MCGLTREKRETALKIGIFKGSGIKEATENGKGNKYEYNKVFR